MFATAALLLLGACKSGTPTDTGQAGITPSSLAASIAPSVAPEPSATATASPTVRPTVTRAPITLRPTVTPRPSRSVRPPITTRPALGDLTIHLASRDCGFYSDTGGGLWLNPTLQVNWTGSGAFPSANLGFAMHTNYGKATAGGPVHSTAPFTWAIGGEPSIGNSWLGHTVKITVTIDPGNDVPETNETNNTTTITVSIPATLPFAPNGSNGDYTIICT
jgi:hypothetical protein